MKRTTVIQAIAILLVALGVWYLVDLFLPFFVAGSDKSIKLLNLIYTGFMVEAGINLYRLKESGRRLAIFLFITRILTNLSLTVWFLIQKGEVTHGFVYFLGKSFPVTDSRLAFVMIMVTWSLVVLLMVAFLVQKKTKELFSAEIKGTASESKAIS